MEIKLKSQEKRKEHDKNMKIFKLHTGNEEARNLTRDNYKEAVLELPKEERENYSEPTENGRRYFAVCSAYDNPTQIIGLYTKSDNVKLPYAKHYNRDSKVAKHNEQAYQFCLFASHSYAVDKKSRKKNFGDFEKRIKLPVDQTFFLHIVNHRKYPKNDEIIQIGKERLPEKILEK